MMTDQAATFGAVYVALYSAHSVADHWIQSQHQADHKGLPGRTGWLADVRHVAGLTLCQLAAVLILVPVLGLRLNGWQLAAGLAVNAITHAWADRRHTLRWLADHVGKSVFYQLGAPRQNHMLKGSTIGDKPIKVMADDNPTLGTGAYILDQSFHIGWLFIAALIIAA